jgi:hypothetical protein
MSRAASAVAKAHRLLPGAAMQRVGTLGVVVGVIFVASPAAADPPWSIGLDYTAAHGGAFETWDLGWRLEAGPGFRIGPWHATASASTNLSIEPAQTARDSNRLFAVGLGGRLAYHMRIDGHGDLYVAAGFERLWISGDAPVRRTCRQTHTCIAGYYPEVPDYDAWAPQVRIGIGPATNLPDMRFAGTFELIVEPIALRDVPPSGISDIALYGAFTFSFGFGPKR